MIVLRQSTAAALMLGPFVDDTDGKTAETALSIAQADVRLSKNGGSPAQKNDATGATHAESGYYSTPVNATDTGTAGRLRVMVSKAGALPVWVDCLVLVANVYDALVAGTDALEVDTTLWKGVTAPDITAPPSAAAVADAVADELLSGHTTPGSAGAAWAAAGSAADPLTNAVPGSYAAGTAGYALGSIDEIKSQTDLIVDGAAVVAAPYSGGLLTITRGSTLSAVVPLTSDLAGRLRLQFAIKRRPGHETDAEAVIYGTEAAGLSRLNGAAYTGSAGHLALSVSAGVSVTVTIDDAVTAQLTPESGLVWALQWETAGGVVSEVSGACVVVADVVRTV